MSEAEEVPKTEEEVRKDEEKVSEEEEMRYEVAVMLTKAGAFERALEGWQQLLEASVEQYGEMGKETANLYYKYGDALLRKAEESGEIFAKDEAKDDEDDDVVVAFEVLEVARLIYEREGDSLNLAETLGRLGDLQKLNGNFMDSLKDYQKCLELRTNTLDGADRRVADSYWCLAVAHEYAAASSDGETDDATRRKDHKKMALENYKLCADSLAKRAENLDKSDPEWKDLDDILEELKETIDSAQEDPSFEELQSKGLVGKASTTFEEKTTVGFFPPANKENKTVNTLQPKRKQDTTAAEPHENPAAKRALHDS